MTDEFDPTLPEEGETQPESQPAPSFDQAFAEMENEIGAELPAGSYVTLRSGSNAPRYAPIFEGETAVSIRVLADRANLMFGGSINIYVDGAQATFETPVVAGTVVTFVGNVKGGVA